MREEERVKRRDREGGKREALTHKVPKPCNTNVIEMYFKCNRDVFQL
jgi:hypothetical protein